MGIPIGDSTDPFTVALNNLHEFSHRETVNVAACSSLELTAGLLVQLNEGQLELLVRCGHYRPVMDGLREQEFFADATKFRKAVGTLMWEKHDR